jgi:hypothetical protein
MSAIAPAAEPAPFDYTPEELRSYLPTGWELLDGGAAAWDPKKKALTLRVLDNVEFDWPVAVTAAAVAGHGRLEALHRAMEDVFRDRLGRPTRGLGIARHR